MTRIVLLGEAYGAKEELFRHAFVGPSGVELARMLGQAGLGPSLAINFPSELEMIAYWAKARREFALETLNVFPLRPNDNNIELFFTKATEGVKSLGPLKPGKYLRPELLPHLEAMWQRLGELSPNLVIALGATALWAVTGEGKISEVRGTTKLALRHGLKVLPTHHPAFILRNYPLRPVVLADFGKAKTEAETPALRRPERWFTIYPSLAEIAEWFTLPADFYAVDIETALEERPMHQITLIGFARSASDALVVPFADLDRPGWSYWPTAEEEMQAWRLTDRALRSKVPKIFQNGIYDLTYLLRAGFRPACCNNDSMLLHHARYAELRKGLGFLGSIYTNERSWKQMRGKANTLKRDE